MKPSTFFPEYIERQKVDGKLVPKELIFDRLYPKMSGTIIKQTTPFDPYALTMVAYLDKNPFGSILSEIDDLGHNVSKTKLLHCTILGLLGDKIPYNPFFEELIKEEIIEIMEVWEKNGNNIDFRLKFNRIRPGSW